MAKITTESNGRRMIRFIAPNGKRPKIRLGKISAEAAQAILEHVEDLAESWTHGHKPLPTTDKWLSELRSDTGRLWLYDRLAAAGLVGAREIPEGERKKPKKAKPTAEAPPETLAAFVDAYIARRTDLKEGTLDNLRYSKRYLVEFFGEDKPLKDVSPGDADEYRAYLRSKVAEATARRYCGRARQFFRAAARKRLIPENPFGDLEGLNVKSNKAREFFITREVAQQVLDAMVDADDSPLVEWQLIFALSRYGALRCPSEHLLLTWGDVDWEHNKFTVHSPKTERHEGKESRVVPLFPELRPYLEVAFNAECDRLGRPPSGTDRVIVKFRYQEGKTNLRTGLLRFLKKAGVKPWPKLFQNLRASRSTELARVFPEYMATAWCGHTHDVAEEHYWQITEADWQRAATECTAEGCRNAGQNPGQKGAKSGPKTPNEGGPVNLKKPQETLEKTRVFALSRGGRKLPGQDSNLE